MSWSHMVLAGAAGVLIIIVVASYGPKRPGTCPDGYVSIYRTSGAAACAAYVVEPMK